MTISLFTCKTRLICTNLLLIIILISLLIKQTLLLYYSLSKSNHIDETMSWEALQSFKQKGPVIDIISVGSVNKKDLHEAQNRTMATHYSVRNFWFATEEHDFEPTCSSDLSRENAFAIAEHCKNSNHINYPALQNLTKYFATPKHYPALNATAAGWLCAQKRPAAGLSIARRAYQLQPFPDYLLIVDDDTYINMELVTRHLFATYPAHRPLAITGCLCYRPQDSSVIPFGGFSTMYTRTFLSRLFAPVHCNTSSNPCDCMAENRIGEGYLFQEGMSIGQLLEEYVKDQPYLKFPNWGNAGFCLHSDWVWEYFVNTYSLADPPVKAMKSAPNWFQNVNRWHIFNVSKYEVSSNLLLWVPYKNEKLKKLHKGRWINATTGFLGSSCRNRKVCTINSHICHYLKADDMDQLHNEYLAYNQTSQQRH